MHRWEQPPCHLGYIDRRPVNFDAARVHLIAYDHRRLPLTPGLDLWDDKEISLTDPVELLRLARERNLSVAKLPSRQSIKNLMRVFPKAETVVLIIEMRHKATFFRMFDDFRLLRPFLATAKYHDKQIRVVARMESPDSAKMNLKIRDVDYSFPRFLAGFEYDGPVPIPYHKECPLLAETKERNDQVMAYIAAEGVEGDRSLYM